MGRECEWQSVCYRLVNIVGIVTVEFGMGKYHTTGFVCRQDCSNQFFDYLVTAEFIDKLDSRFQVIQLFSTVVLFLTTSLVSARLSVGSFEFVKSRMHQDIFGVFGLPFNTVVPTYFRGQITHSSYRIPQPEKVNNTEEETCQSFSGCEESSHHTLATLATWIAKVAPLKGV
uniref:Uncharacterized protein n=1 Tax=Rhizobium leguminosarum bv. trifolii TaxID=386 RepID=A0A1C9HXH3_RHILT|nr:hypothetical protein [Rhizobium leguminosarum bv. trifolii]